MTTPPEPPARMCWRCGTRLAPRGQFGGYYCSACRETIRLLGVECGIRGCTNRALTPADGLCAVHAVTHRRASNTTTEPPIEYVTFYPQTGTTHIK